MHNHACRRLQSFLILSGMTMILSPPDDNDNNVSLKKITTRMSQNLILRKNADQPKAYM
jgi:hypothetical protein